MRDKGSRKIIRKKKGLVKIIEYNKKNNIIGILTSFKIIVIFFF